MEKQLKRKESISADRGWWLGIFVISVLFYLMWYWMDGIILTEDAPSYITMTSDREPGYCTFLAVMRILFGDYSLHAAVIVQCVIAGVAAAAITMGLKRRFLLGRIGMLLVLLIQYGVTLLNRFVAQRRYSYYNSIETEGLCYSLWIFFFLAILGILYGSSDGQSRYDNRKNSIVMALLWSVVLISIRKHMLITLILLVLCLLYTGFRERQWKSAFVSAVLCGAAALVMTTLIDCCYNYVVRGDFTSHSGDSSFILGTELYLADEGMAQAISSEEQRELFLEIMRRADDKEYNIAYARKGLPTEGIQGSFLWNWQTIQNHYSLSYDRIKFDVVMVVIREYQDQIGIAQEDRGAHYNEIAGGIMKALLVPCILNLMKLYVCNVLHGMITTILKVHRLLNWAAVVIYCLYITLFIGLWRRGCVESLPFAAAVLLSVVVNVCFTSLTIYPQMRYMLYNTALFYQAGLVMCIDAYRQMRA